MTELLTAAQMRAIEAAAIASGQVTGLELMERAGAGVVAAVLEEWPDLALAPQRAVVLCGPGNNGGDGFVVARLLQARGWEVEVFLYGDPSRLPPDATTAMVAWRDAGGRLRRLTARSLPSPPFALWFDALFGTGLSRPLVGEIGAVLGEMDDNWHWFIDKGVAIDVPSGLCADSGRPLGPVMPAALTVTFHRQKPGHLLGDGSRLCRKVVTVDIGLDAILPKPPPPGPRFIPRRAPGLSLVAPPARIAKAASSHKYTHGHALILSGPATRTGAARLAARGALRIGAGLVTVGAPDDALPECAAHLTAIMLWRVAAAADLTALLEDTRINALCLGPGLGADARAAGLVAAALGLATPSPPSPLASPPSPLPRERGATAEPLPSAKAAAPGEGASPLPGERGGGRGSSQRPTVLDADALTHLARDETLFAALHPACILTPHAGEFARLFPDIAAKLDAPATTGPAYSKVDATREAAKRAGCVVLCKGPDTVIADPSGRCAINAAVYERSAPWLATAGSGDVLAGFIAGLLARGFAPFDAACTAAWLHVECALQFGPGLIAEDLPEQLPRLLAKLMR